MLASASQTMRTLQHCILTSWSALTHASAHEHNRGSLSLVDAAARRQGELPSLAFHREAKRKIRA